LNGGNGEDVYEAVSGTGGLNVYQGGLNTDFFVIPLQDNGFSSVFVRNFQDGVDKIAIPGQLLRNGENAKDYVNRLTNNGRLKFGFDTLIQTDLQTGREFVSKGVFITLDNRKIASFTGIQISQIDLSDFASRPSVFI
jgi:hypothetical protein